MEQDEDDWIDAGWSALSQGEANRNKLRREDRRVADAAPTALYPEPFDREAQVQAWANSPPASPAPEDDEPYNPSGHLFPLKVWDPPIYDNAYARINFYRLCMYYEADMKKMHKEIRRPEIALACRELDIPPAPPRPKLPVNGRWRKWLEPFMTSDLNNEALRARVPRIEGYKDLRDWYEGMRKYGKAMQVWVLNRRDEYFRSKFHLLAKEAAKKMVQNAPDTFNYIKAVFPMALPSQVYKSDSSAPPLLRHHHWWTYARVASHGTSGGYYLIQSNVDYIPPLLPACFRRLCINGFYGPHELLRYAQWHQVGLWHLAFILTCRDGLVHKALHNELKPGKIELYRVNVQLDFEQLENKRFRLRPGLFRAFGEAFSGIVSEHEELALPSWTLLTRPHEAELVFSRGLQYLAEQQVTERDALETTAALQRSIGELRAWNRYMSTRKRVETQRARANKIIPMGADLRVEKYRQYTRGVFTEDEYVAKLYAQYGVPVFYVQHMKSRYWVPDLRCVEVQVQALHCETRAYEDERSLRAYAPLQEYAAVPTAPLPCLPAAPPSFQPRRVPRASWDDEPMLRHDDEPMLQNDDEPMLQNDDAPMPQNDEGGVIVHELKETTVRKDRCDNAQSMSTAGASDSRMQVDAGPVPRKRKGGAEGAAKQKKKKKKTEQMKSSVQKPKGPGKRARKLPPWWLASWKIALDEVRAIDPRDMERIEMLQSAAQWPVPKDQYRAMTYATPVVDQLGSMEACPSTISKMFATLVQLYPFLLYTIGSTPARDLQRWSPKWWKEILKHQVHPQMQPAFAERLGVDSHRATIVDVPDEADPTSFDVTLPAGLHNQPPASTDVAPVAERTAAANPARNCAAQFAPASGQISWAYDYNSDSEDEYGDGDDDIDMTGIGSPSAPPATPKYFVPVETAIEGPPLLQPGQRYLNEPDGWRFKGIGQARGLNDFVWFLEENGDFDDLEFVEVGAAVRTQNLQKRSTEVWWDYQHGRAFIFTGHPSAREGPLDGERLTQPLRVFRWDGAKRPDYIWNTKTAPVQLRLWRAQNMSQPLVVPAVPLGPVGSRMRCRSIKANFSLDDASYAHFFPSAPRTLPRAQLQPDEEEPAAAATSLASRGSAAATVVAASALTGVEMLPTSMVSTSATTSTSTTSVQTLTASQTARRLAKRAYWQQQGFDEVPAVGAPLPLRDALQPSCEMQFEGRRLTIYEPPAEVDSKNYHWPSTEDRAWIVWHIAELEFRLELFALDDVLRTTYGNDEKLHEHSNAERQKLLCNIWGADSFIPRSENPLVAPDWRTCVAPVLAFAAVVSSWPRVSLPDLPAQFESEDRFLQYEKHLWSTYACTYADYHLREAPVPMHRPPVSPPS